MGAGHSHAIPDNGNEKALWWALGLTSTFLIVEAVAGFLTNSLALISDAAHMLTDSAALAIALLAMRIGRRPVDAKRTFGYSRFEILAAAMNAVLLFLVAFYILYEAYQRVMHPAQIQSSVMLAVAVLGLVINLISMRMLHGGKDHSLNLKGAYLEVWSDMLSSLGVIIGALIIRWTGWSWVDSVVAIGIGVWVLPRSWMLLKESLNVLLEGIPAGIEFIQIETAILAIPGVSSLHDLHVWAISSNKISLTVHVVREPGDTGYASLLTAIRQMLAERFNIHHATVQLEDLPCEQDHPEHSFSAKHVGHDHEHGNAHDHAHGHSGHAHP
ncbi:cation diffusion facilitator family transporter [Herbaspirillum sp. RTI4]|uniref:cation diffusion facilitator family transporter n=1 Tax=Herbaspirillum sp. RTI4 TaxID=3048640 RepID=UPI002AB46F02|nr:cation diffusion facilitator family transporter [Herbaspirillum sp. RTI4]MDY7576760.1 cation diffusion facilitator family transporter [Herbaspirillum sp. RTI4]MEA9981356.1 cation diffusion facilitator family transporter [Herbaspirillum sp. RTI4]